MAKHKHAPIDQRARPPLLLLPPPDALLDNPIEYLLADHSRQRELCAALQEFAVAGQACSADARTASSFLIHDRALHHLDEEEDLFPAMCRRTLPEDELDALLTRLRNDHRRSDILAGRIVSILSASMDRQHVPIGKAEAELITAFAISELRHLAVENGVLLVIAQIRLNQKDLQKMSASMKTRRGVPA